jgi:hypothetical protein
MRWRLLVALLVPTLAVLAVRWFPDVVLPLKVQVAVGMLGWRGFAHTVIDVVATKTLGAKDTLARTQWHDLLHTLHALDTQYLVPDRGVVSDDDIAEGHMLGLHLLATAIDQYAFTDAHRPELRLMVNKDRKWMGDNPDTVYYGTAIDADTVYVVRGKRAGEAYLSVTVYTWSFFFFFLFFFFFNPRNSFNT